jgi:hypothetical protein
VKKKESEKLVAAAAERHETARQHALACRERAHLADTAADQALGDERVLRALLASQPDEPTTEQIDELKRLAGQTAETRVVADLALARAQAADKALQHAAKTMREAQRVEAEVAYHEAQLAMSARLLELAPLHQHLNATLAQHLAHGGMDRPAGLEATFAWAQGIQAEAAAREQKPQSSPNPHTAVIMLRSVSVDTYGQFNAGEPCGFTPSISAALVAQGDARWAVDGEFPSRSALMRSALNIINNVARMLGRRTTENDVIETGWQSA